MLSEQIVEETGKVTGVRVLNATGPKMEVSMQNNGKMSGIDYQSRTTYTSAMQVGGFLFGEGQSVMTVNGMAVWKGQGTGMLGPDGGGSFRGCFHPVTTIGHYNNVATKYWEWAKFTARARPFLGVWLLRGS